MDIACSGAEARGQGAMLVEEDRAEHEF
jgi:hypothetical protein